MQWEEKEEEKKKKKKKKREEEEAMAEEEVVSLLPWDLFPYSRAESPRALRAVVGPE